MTERTRSSRVELRGWVVVVAVVAAGTATIGLSFTIGGLPPRGHGAVIGAGLAPILLAGGAAALHVMVRTQLRNVSAVKAGVPVFASLPGGEFARGMRELGLLPVWRVGLVAVSVGGDGLEFWSGVRSPFVFARIAADRIGRIRLDSTLALRNPERFVSVRVSADDQRQVTLELRPLRAHGFLVTVAPARELNDLHVAIAAITDN